jgi:hypothetical protein
MTLSSDTQGVKNTNKKILVSICFIALLSCVLMAGSVIPLKVVAGDTVQPDFSNATIAPYPLTFYSGNPTISVSTVTDRTPTFTADPFIYYENGVWYLFFEVQSSGPSEIGLATSNDGFHWTYQKIVLSPGYHIAFPNVFKYNNHYYMVPETDSTNSVRLFEASNFPYGWTLVSVLLSGRTFEDPQVFCYNALWWMYVSTIGPAPYYNSGNCYLYYANSPLGPWTEHPKSPIVRSDTSKSCGAGRPVLYAGNTLLRLAQKCNKYYGEAVRAFQVDTLTTTDYAEHEISASPLLAPTGTGAGQAWSRDGMHTLNVWWTGTQWIASVDGETNNGIWSIGIYATAKTNSNTVTAVTLTFQPFNLIINLNITSGASWTAPTTISLWDKTWQFVKWSDGLRDQTRTLTDQSYTLQYG